MKRWALVTVTILATVSFVTGPSAPTAWAQPLTADEVGSWPMVAANPQRTSWTPEQVSGDVHVEWYRPIDAYIPPNFQVIAANDLIYISSARGLYALRYDTGELAWRYDTELPLGNSPTIATINGTSMAFVGGYDKKLHAFNALTGEHLWEFAGATAGYDANPLVINNTVYVGNRDGHFYAIDAARGSLVWRYPQGEPGIGAIHLSPAYNNNTLYFATGYNYAYALDLNGTLKWDHPVKLGGDGYYAYWPVVYTDTSVTPNKDYVIFSSKIPYRENAQPGTRSEAHPDWDSYSMYGDGIGSFPQAVTLNEPWAAGKTILDYSVVSSYLQQKPHLRTYPILDGATGAEAAVFPNIPMANPNVQSPPVVLSDLLFISNARGNGRHHIMGWKFGTPYFADTVLDGAGDEPILLSAGGSNIYKVLCCSRAAWYTSLPSLSGLSTLWPYGGNSLGHIAPGYDERLHYLDPSNPLDNISVIFGNANGVYGYHGDQNPIVPYKGKLYSIKGNCVLSFGAGTARGIRPLLTASATTQPPAPLSDAELKSRLETEIQKIVSAGILKPGYQDDSQFSSGGYYLLDNYFDNPGDTLYTLSMAYPYLSESLKTQVKGYLKNTLYPRYYQNGIASRIGWKEGAQRDSIPYPPDLAADMQTLDDNYDQWLDGSLTWFCPGYMVNPQNYYALWKYAQMVAPEDVQAIYALALEKIGPTWWGGPGGTVVPPSADDATLIRYPYQLNAWISGYYGFLKLQELAGKTVEDADVRSAVTATYSHLYELRLNNFSKDTPFNDASGYGRNFLNISRNFIWLIPELAADLRQNNLVAVQQALDEYNTVAPYWFVSRFNAAAAESGLQNLYDYPSNFQARAWILDASREELSKWLDVPAFERGDLFYIQNLIAAIEAQPEGRTPTFADVPFSHPYHDVIEVLYQAGYTAGCNTSPLMYCPEATMNRAESSVFVERGIHTATYDPPAPASQVFADVSLDSWAGKWVNGLWQDQYTAGCGTNPLIYCPWQGHTRAEGCVFYLRMLRGATYEPAQPAQQTFVDVPLDAWYAKWVQAGYDAGLLGACQTTPELRFCPNDALTRALAAYMMVQAKDLTPLTGGGSIGRIP